MDAELALKKRIEEIGQFLKSTSQEIESLDQRRETVVNERRNAERDLDRAHRALDALQGNDEPKKTLMGSENAMAVANPNTPYYPEGN